MEGNIFIILFFGVVGIGIWVAAIVYILSSFFDKKEEKQKGNKKVDGFLKIKNTKRW